MGARRSFLNWLLGDRAASVLFASWNWLWGKKIDEGGDTAVAVAEDAVIQIQQNVQDLLQAVATQVAGYQRAQQLHQQKVKDYEGHNAAALKAKNLGRIDIARAELAAALAIEGALPTMEANVAKARKFAENAKEKLTTEQTRLEEYNTRLKNMKDINEINRALSAMAAVNNQYDIGSAVSVFEQADNAVARRQFQVEAVNELSVNPAEKLASEARQMSLEADIDARLAALGQSPIQTPIFLPKQEKEEA